MKKEVGVIHVTDLKYLALMSQDANFLTTLKQFNPQGEHYRNFQFLT